MNIEGYGPVTVADFLVPDEGGGDDQQQQQQVDDQGAIDDDDLADQITIDGETGEIVDDLDAEGDGEGEGDDDGAKPVPMPSSWSKDDKAAWDSLTPDQQTTLARREEERDRYVRKIGWEATNARDQERRNSAEAQAKLYEAHAAALSVYAQVFQPQLPDQSLLYTGNPDDVLTYQRQDAAYRNADAQQQQLQQAVSRAQQQALAVRTEQDEAERQVDLQRLHEQLPEWFEESTAPRLRQELQAVGAELGYPVELMAEASSVDILALKKAADWKSKAKKYDKIVAKRMETVRAAKTLPRMARPGATPGKGTLVANANSRRTEALQEFGQTRSGAAAAALLFERKR